MEIFMSIDFRKITGAYPNMITPYDADGNADYVENILSMAAFTECPAYPITAKYHFSEIEGIKMALHSRSREADQFTPYNEFCIRQMDTLARHVLDSLKK